MKQNGNFRLLIVDDEEDLREALAFSLSRQGFRIEEASCGNEAIAKMKEEKFDLVVSDVRMPKGTGLDIVDFAKSQGESQPPVVLVTGFSDVSNEEASHRGATHVFEKPLVRKEFISKVNEILGCETGT